MLRGLDGECLAVREICSIVHAIRMEGSGPLPETLQGALPPRSALPARRWNRRSSRSALKNADSLRRPDARIPSRSGNGSGDRYLPTEVSTGERGVCLQVW